jgi:glycosyltransferase involved in cell wall biosynthesis
MKIRVLHVIDHLGYGGAPFVVKGIVERMPAERVESIVCALRPNRKSLPIAAEVITLQGFKYSPAAIWSIARICRERRIDILHAHLQKAVIGSLLATYLCRSRLILHEHGPIFRRGAGCLYRGFIRLLGRRADAIIANSEAAKSAVRQTLRTAEVPIVVVPNFVDVQQFDPDRYDRASVRESLGLDPAQCVVGFVGRLDRAKGTDLLVEAAAILRDQDGAYRFLVVGDGPERDRLDAQIQKLGLDRMVILTGLRENTAAIMRAFDVGVVPSRREAFGIAALELMRMKVPVIVSPVGGLPELVQDGRTGIILSELSPAAIAQAIQRLKKDAALREQLSRNGFEHAGLYDGGRAVQQIVGVYERLVRMRRQESDAREHARGA